MMNAVLLFALCYIVIVALYPLTFGFGFSIRPKVAIHFR